MPSKENSKPCRIIVKKIIVSEDKCTKCGECIEYCPFNALVKNEDGFPIGFEEKCTACLVCMALCLPSAIRIIVDWSCDASR